jgi:microsomal dipeptidase-like Zn-dependent dipeptidase
MRRQGDPVQVGALLAIERLHALDGTLASVDTLYAHGFRMLGLTHFFDNDVTGSAHGVSHGVSHGGHLSRSAQPHG